MAQEAALGGDPRLGWFREFLDEEARTGKAAAARVVLFERTVDQKRTDRARNGKSLERPCQAYAYKESGFGTWDEIAHEVGYATCQSAKLSARRYAFENGLRWPVRT